MFIYIGCSGGGTSSMFCQRITMATQTEAISATFSDLDTVMRAPNRLAAEHDLIFAYGGIDALQPVILDEFSKLFDVVLVAPQVRYRTAAKRELLKDYPVIVQDIDSKIFGMMDGATALEGLLELLVAVDNERGYASQKTLVNKAGDKNMEIFVMGGDRKNVFFKAFVAALRARDLRVLEESYSLECLYDTKGKGEYDLRLLYGVSSFINERDLPKFANRIDLIMQVPLISPGFKKRSAWIERYQIPIIELDGVNVGRGAGALELERINEYLVDASLKTEFQKELTIPELELEPKKERKKFAFLTWNAG